MTQWAAMSATSRTLPVATLATLAGVAAVAAVGLSACAGGSGAPAAGSGTGTGSPAASASPAGPTRTADPGAPSSWGPTLGELARARDLVGAMTTRERASTVLMPGFSGYVADSPTAAEAQRNEAMHGVDTATEALAENPFGGVFLRPEVIADADQVDTLARELHRSGDRPDGLPLLVSIDQEGGSVQRLKAGVPVVPSAAAVGARDDPAYARQVARSNGSSLRRLGVTMVMAPVADVDPDGRSVMGSRTYSPDREVAARMVTATVRGYLQAGVIPAVKHFPGLGSVSGDSHHALPVQDKSLARLRRTDLVPFSAAIDAGAPVVMTAHLAVDAVEPGMPGSISRGRRHRAAARHPRLRGRGGHRLAGHGPDQRALQLRGGSVRSLLAGDDLVLNSPYPAAPGGRWCRPSTPGGCPRPGWTRRRPESSRCGCTSSGSRQPLADPSDPVRGSTSTRSSCLGESPSPLDRPRSRRSTHGVRCRRTQRTSATRSLRRPGVRRAAAAHATSRAGHRAERGRRRRAPPAPLPPPGHAPRGQVQPVLVPQPPVLQRRHGARSTRARRAPARRAGRPR